MARKRMINPSIWDTAFEKQWKADELLVFMACITNADDEGRGRIGAVGRACGSMIIGGNDLHAVLLILKPAVITYKNKYYFLPGWHDEQKISHPTASKLPIPEMNGEHPESSGENPTRSSLVSLNNLVEQTNGCRFSEIDDVDKILKAYEALTTRPPLFGYPPQEHAAVIEQLKTYAAKLNADEMIVTMRQTYLAKPLNNKPQTLKYFMAIWAGEYDKPKKETNAEHLARIVKLSEEM